MKRYVYFLEIVLIFFMSYVPVFGEGNPEIITIEAASSAADQEVIIKGVNFGTSQGSVELRIKSLYRDKNIPMSAVIWNDKEIQVTIPYKDIPCDENPEAEIVVKIADQEIKKPINTRCIKTDIPYYTEFFSGAEYTLKGKDSKNFSQAYPHIGLRVNKKFCDNAGYVPVVRGFSNFRLTSIAIARDANTQDAKKEIVDEKSLETNIGLVLSYPLKSDSMDKTEIGIVLKGGGQTSDTEQSFLIKTFYGIRILQAGILGNGAYIDIGWGRSDNFVNTAIKDRYKLEGYLPLNSIGLGKGIINAFLASNIEADLGNDPDTVTFVVGALVELDKLQKGLGNILESIK